jgi:glycosyltransferase involved in cell wall biosynthesis
MGTSVWFESLQQADWGKEWQVDFFNVNIHSSMETLGKTRLNSIGKNLALYKKLKQQLKATHYQLVLIPISQETIGFIKDAGFIRIATKRADKVLLMLHGSNFLNWQKNSTSVIRKYTKSTLKKANGMIVLGEQLKSLFADHFAAESIYSVPNGADFTFPGRTMPGSGKTKILYLSNLQPAKGITDLVDALVLLQVDKEQYEVDVVGHWMNDEIKKYCLALKEKYQLPIHFHGPVYGEAKLKYFSEAEIFVFPPRAPEGHPLVIVEAMAAGLPVISTDQGAITESVIDGKNGYIVASANPAEIARKIEYLVQNPEKRTLMGKESRRLYEELFTRDQMIGNFKKVFHQVLDL